MYEIRKLDMILEEYGRPEVKQFSAFDYKMVKREKNDNTECTLLIFVRKGCAKEYGEVQWCKRENKTIGYVKSGNDYVIEVPVDISDANLNGFRIANNYFDLGDLIKIILGEEVNEKEILQKLLEKEFCKEVTEHFVRKKKETLDRISAFTAEKCQYIQRIISITKEIDEMKIAVRIENDVEEAAKRAAEEIRKIYTHKKVKNVDFQDGSLIIDTEPLYIGEPVTNRRYYLGKMQIEFDINEGVMRFKNKNNQRKCFWGFSHHPHVDEAGHPCLGTAECQIAQYIADNEYYAVFITALNFLQTCDIDDCAGYHVSQWDEVDENGNIIRKGHYPTKNEYGGNGYINEGYDVEECPICGEDISDGNGVYVECCDREVCENCVQQTWNGNYICDECAESENWYICRECGDYVNHNDVIIHNDKYYCPNCFENLDEEER